MTLKDHHKCASFRKKTPRTKYYTYKYRSFTCWKISHLKSNPFLKKQTSFSELGQLRGAAAIGVLTRGVKVLPTSSPVKAFNNSTRDDSGVVSGETTDVTDSVVSTATLGPSTLVESPTVFTNSPNLLLLSANTTHPQPETLNIPAVLWDRPSGSSKRVPPPVPPRSPRRPIDHLASFAAAAGGVSTSSEGRGVNSSLPNTAPTSAV